MPRISVLEAPSNPGLYTPYQLQPHAVLDLAFSSLCQWMRDHLAPHREQVSSYNSGWVLYGVHIEFDRPLTYYDCDTVTVRGQATALRHGAQLDYRADIGADGRVAARVRLVCAGLWLGDGDSLAGVYARINQKLLDRFAPEELALEEAYDSPLPELERDLRAGASIVASDEHPFQVWRHNCEFADQWYFAEVPRWVGAAREKLCMSAEHETANLRDLLSQPVERVDIRYTRPCYFTDEGRVSTDVFRDGDSIVFLHKLVSDEPRKTHVVVAERFAAP